MKYSTNKSEDDHRPFSWRLKALVRNVEKKHLPKHLKNKSDLHVRIKGTFCVFIIIVDLSSICVICMFCSFLVFLTHLVFSHNSHFPVFLSLSLQQRWTDVALQLLQHHLKNNTQLNKRSPSHTDLNKWHNQHWNPLHYFHPNLWQFHRYTDEL